MIHLILNNHYIVVYVDNRLKWDNHISQMKCDTYTELSKLKKTFRFWNTRTFKVLYRTYVKPKLEYCAPVWSPFKAENIAEIEAVQKNAIKIMTEMARHMQSREK